MAPWPCSAALVRVSKTRGSWLAALSFHPRRLFADADLKVMVLARRMLLSHRQQALVFERLRQSHLALLRCLTATIDARGPYTAGHSERVARIAVRLGQQMGLPEPVLADLYLAGLLHDVGMVGIRDSVLAKPDRLTDLEFEHVKQHTTIGDRLIGNIKSLQHLRPAIRHHHERYDGKGYPDGLAGERIPLMARILAVADTCDALLAARPHRAAIPEHKADAILLEGAGSQWDADVIAQFMVCRHELYAICKSELGDAVLGGVGLEEPAPA
jgi:HD-GYP domain-containing protein (c-di-GMP phosphodiesterase class II)